MKLMLILWKKKVFLKTVKNFLIRIRNNINRAIDILIEEIEQLKKYYVYFIFCGILNI